MFPLFHTRFISINDNFDSDQHKGDTGGMDVAFKYLISEYYSRDMSIKTKSAKYAKMQRGEYQSKVCPYGYRKSANSRMEPNPETAAVVQLIFQLAATGIGAAAVTRELFKRGIPTPGEHKAAHGQQYHDVSRSRGRWSSSTVLRILEDERYIGSYVIGRRAVIEVGGTRSRRKNRDKWFLDASYSYGSFNTHKSYVNFGQTFRSGLTYEINVFQNYSDNNYYVDTPVKDFTTGAINKKKIEHVKRFHDTYHNEAVIGKIGFVDKKWADRLMFGFTYSHMYKDIQTGVRQEVVFGGKYRKGYSIMPSLDYRKRDFFVRGLDLVLTANYNKNMTNNVDTSSYEYNWRGEMRPLRMPGEQSYQNTRSDNNNWNGTLTANYRIGKAHTFTFNHVINAFRRSNQSLLNEDSEANAIPKETRKNISGLSYRLMPTEHWNLSVFGKYYNQFIAGPVATSSAQDDYIRTTNSVSAMGYGAAGTYFILKSLQAKLSYEKAYRLPTNEEMFGDEDLETGDISLKPENSDNVNLNLSYNETFGKHSVYVEGGLIYRNTKDYIQRNISDLSGGKYGATYVNHGRVETKGYNISVRYGFANWVSVGGNFTQMNVRDNVKTVTSGTNQESLTYGARMPNLPYQFANSDVTFYWRNLWKKGNTLSVTYDNLYMHSFPLYSEAVGSESEFVVPTQFSHNLTLSYGIQNGRYNISFECRNLTNEKLYDNFSLQKAGRAFYGKVRVYFGN